jgi:transposase-like protein
MKTVNEQKRLLARDLFFQSGKSQGEIANEVGVSDKTLYLWTREGDWHRLRSASRLMPSMIIENFYAQVQELNDDIRSRPPGKRYPTLQESEIIRKMMLTIERSKKKHTQPEYMELMQKFLEWVGPKNIEILQTITDYADGFLKSQSVAGFHPYDIEYEEPALASLRGTKQSHENTEEAEPTEPQPQPQVDFPLASLPVRNADGLGTSQAHEPGVTKQSHDNTEEATATENTQSEIIGTYENLSQLNENQQENPANTPTTTDNSVIIKPPEISNNDYKPNISPEDLDRLMTLLEKMNEINERNDKPKPEEEGQLYSIGEKVFRMKPR